MQKKYVAPRLAPSLPATYIGERLFSTTQLPRHMTTPKIYLEQQHDRFVEELKNFLRIPSVGVRSEHNQDTYQAATYLRDELLAAGADTARLIETEGHPLVYGEKLIDPSLPTVLFYGHYDVQPVEPYDLWTAPPFEPVVRDEKVYARGASDDKGQVYLHVKALETMLVSETLPCNIKYIIEGEEEQGSAHFMDFLEDDANVELLQADAMVISDTGLFSMEQPSLQTGVRGIVCMEMTATGPCRDLHSGIYGGAVDNPIHVLCKLLGKLHDAQGRVTVPGFYDDVLEVSAQDREQLAQAPFDLAAYKEDLAIAAVAGEEGYTTLERTGIRPALEVNGIWGGYTDAGFKTVLPAQAHAKMSLRLVPDQPAAQLAARCKEYLLSLAPPTVKLEVNILPGASDAVVVDLQSPVGKAAAKAFEQVWQKTPIPMREGGSLPILAALKKALNIDIALMGFGLHSDNVHSPDENFGLKNFFMGIETAIAFYQNFAQAQKQHKADKKNVNAL